MINWFMHMYPYGNLHELDLDWVIATVKHGEKEIADFIGINTIKYADPILWNIESQYEANTVVVDAQTGNAYISVKAVPSGVHLNRTEYWTQIYNYANVVDTLREQIAHNEGESTTATQPYHVNDLVFINGELYRVTHNMIAGDSFVVDSNIEKTTIEHELGRIKSDIEDEAEARADADTQLQTNIDNEARARADADTQLQTNIDNEATARADADTQLQTNIDNEATARQQADNEILEKIADMKIYNVVDYGAIGDGVTDDTQAIQSALSDALNAKGILYFPAGTYILNTIINILQGHGITILGCGESILKAGSSITLVKGTHTQNVKLINMIFEGYVSTNLPTIDCEFIGSYISGCKFINHGTNTAFLLRNHNNKIVNCEFINDGTGDASALKCGVLGGDDGENWTINNIIHGCYIESTRTGIHIVRQTLAHLQEGLVIDDCIILGMGNSSVDGIRIDALFAGTISNCIIDQWQRNGIYMTGTDMNANIKIQGCYIMGQFAAVNAQGNNQISAIVLDSNTIYTVNDNSGFFMSNISKVIISNNDFHVSWGAFNFAQTAKNIQFVNNFVEAGRELGTLNSPSGNIIIKDNISNTVAVNGTYVTDNPSYSFDAQGHVTITHTNNWTVQFENNILTI